MEITPRDYQDRAVAEIIDAYDRKINRQLNVMATGTGKCHPAGTTVLMHNGTIKKVENLQVGDQLMGPDSNPRTIKSLATGTEKIYEITPSKGESWRCNESHILSLVYNGPDRVHKKKNDVVNISVKKYLQQHKTFKHTHKLYKTGVDFEPKMLNLDPYYLGLWLGDGTSVRAEITSNESVIINTLKEYFKDIRQIEKRRDETQKWDLTKTILLPKLQQNNLLNNKHIPHKYLTNSRKNRLKLLAGLLDTDGYLHRTSYEITVKQEKFADDIVFLSRSLGFSSQKVKKIGTIKTIGFEGVYWRVHISGDTHQIPCKVERKKAPKRKQKKNPLRYGFDVVDIGVDKYYGFTLDKDHLYLLSDFTVTHNTYTATFLRNDFRPDRQTIFMVDEIQLAYQARKSFLTADPNLNVGIEMNKHKSSDSDDVIITSVPTIGRAGSKRIKRLSPDNIGLVIVDEAHKSVSESWIRTLNYLQVGPENFDSEKLLLGMTATPNRPDGKPLKLLYDDITVNYDIRWALKNGWLTDFEFYRVDTDTDISNVKKSRGEFNQKELANAVNNDERNAQIYKAYKEHSDGEPAIVFCASVDHAKYLTKLFNHNGVPSAVIHANTSSKDRAEYIKKFKTGEIKVLFNYGTLTTGFDAPDTRTIILARPIGSELLYQQIIGRGLRPSTDSFVNQMDDAEERKMAMRFSKKPTCKIIDFHDVTKKRDVCTPAVLFGFHSELKAEQGSTYYKDVVEKLDQVKKEESIDVSKITDLDNIDLHVKREKVDLSQVMNIPEEIMLHSDKSWVKIDDGQYEIIYPDDKKVLIVSENKLGKYDVDEYDMSTKDTERLNSFGSLAGAINSADKYANWTYDTTFDEMIEWADDGVTTKQAKFLRQFLKWDKEFREDRNERYEDTGQPHMYYEGELLSKGKATLLLNRLFNK